MYINSGAIYVHSATGVLTVRGGKQLSVGGGFTSGVGVFTLPPASGEAGGKKINCMEWKEHIVHLIT